MVWLPDGTLTRYVQSRVAYVPGIPGTFSPQPTILRIWQEAYDSEITLGDILAENPQYLQSLSAADNSSKLAIYERLGDSISLGSLGIPVRFHVKEFWSECSSQLCSTVLYHLSRVILRQGVSSQHGLDCLLQYELFAPNSPVNRWYCCAVFIKFNWMRLHIHS